MVAVNEAFSKELTEEEQLIVLEIARLMFAAYWSYVYVQDNLDLDEDTLETLMAKVDRMLMDE